MLYIFISIILLLFVLFILTTLFVFFYRIADMIRYPNKYKTFYHNNYNHNHNNYDRKFNGVIYSNGYYGSIVNGYGNTSIYNNEGIDND